MASQPDAALSPPSLVPVTFVDGTDAPAWAVPVGKDAIPRKPARAARAGFGTRALSVAEVVTRKRRKLLIRCGDDLEAVGALATARLSMVEHIAIDARGWSPEHATRLAAGAVLRAWRFRRFMTRPDPDRPLLARIDVLCDDPDAAAIAWRRMQPGVLGAAFARDLVIEPSNALTPASFADHLRALERHGIQVEVLDRDALREHGFGGLLAVGEASANPPCLAVLRWPGRFAAQDPVLFVGKGITFDTGGVCIKPAHGLWEMRADMAGAAACAGAMLALALRDSPAPAVAILPLAENAIGASSFRPGDVLRLQAGSTVEIVDTDAEGRLVLADALAWGIARFKPQAVIDLATLTGSIVTALGHDMAGMFANDDVLAAHLAASGASVDERAWRMPLNEGYGEALESDIADIRQCSDGRLQPDACLAAHFLNRFVGATPWVHLDIAGVESNEDASDRHPAGPTGWGARLLDRLVQDRFENEAR